MSPNESPAVLVVGPGALGSALGVALRQRGLAVGFAGRQGPLAHAFTLDPGSEAGLARGVTEEAFPAPDAAFLARVALVFVAVKAYEVKAALEVAATLTEGAPVVPIGNGSLEGVLRRHHEEREPGRTFRIGSATVGVSELAPAGDGAQASGRAFAVRSTAGVVSFGPFLGASEPTPVEAALTAAGGLFRWAPNAVALHRRKWLYNTVINSLCAARRLPRNGELLAHREEVEQVFDEAFRLGHELWGPWDVPRETLFGALTELIRMTAGNENSMARDVRLGAETETAALAGLARGRDGFPRLRALDAWIAARR